MNKGDRTTSGFTQAEVYARRQFCANLKVCTPQEVQWKPPLRQAATTLVASGGQRNRKRLNGNVNNRSERAEQRKTSLKSVQKSEKLTLIG